MRKMLILFFILCLTQMAHGFNLDHVTINSKPHRIKYTGITGALIDEYESQLDKLWEKELSHRYEIGVYDDVELSIALREADRIFTDAKYGTWWDRPWWDSLECAPQPIVVIAGPKKDILDLGFVKITNKWKLKLKEYETDIIADYSPFGKIRSGWKFKFSPLVDFSTRHPIIRQAAFRFGFTWIEFKKSILHVDIHVGYKTHHCELFIELNASLVQW